MPRAATMPSPVCHTSLLTTNTRLSRVADSFFHASLFSTSPRAILGRRRVERHVDDVAVGEREVGELSRSSSVVPISTYGLSVNRCAAGRSTPTAASTLPGKLSGPKTRNGVVGELHDRRLEMGGVVLGAGPVGGRGRSRRSAALAASARPVAAPTVRRLSCQPAPGAPVNTVGAIADSSAYASGVRPANPGSDRGRAARIASRSGALRVPTAGTSCTTRAEIGRLGVGAVGQRGGDDARLQAQRAQRVELVAGEHHDALRIGRHARCSPAAWRTSRVGGRPGRARRGSGAQDSSGLR